MPFVQRIVQPVNVAQATAASLGHAAKRFQCAPGKCTNNNCINNQNQSTNHHRGAEDEEAAAAAAAAAAADEPQPPAALPMKKLKQHVEFLSTSPSHLSTRVSQSLPASRQSSQQRGSAAAAAATAHPARTYSAPHSPTAAAAAGSQSRVVSGHEFDSISNITLSNALRQLASLVLIASDIFDELQHDLQQVGERAARVQRKITAVERRVCAYDPKMVTVRK
ncbi:GH23371 [Drosophila grimshawi]|uniref:GH23371 n=1 Tax=Drosophila grimshawi TaxID=7222 RepID=B4K1X1_DROGR|nr:GH23371 [Drosophila grimshawi]